jgi:hypothetical protein
MLLRILGHGKRISMAIQETTAGGHSEYESVTAGSLPTAIVDRQTDDGLSRSKS